jgi:hypothetical protein
VPTLNSKWDGHSYWCKCHKWPKGYVVSIG